MIFSFYFYDSDLSVKRAMVWNQMIKDDIFLAFYMLFILCGWEINPCIFSRLPLTFSHMSGVEFSSLHQVNVKHRESC
jgi:hypothetical protein